MVSISHNKYIEITLKQEYVLLTGNYKKAILLEFFIIKQDARGEWFNVSYDKISKNSLLGLSLASAKKHICEMIKMGLIDRRKNENSLTYQYKVNVDKIMKDVGQAAFFSDDETNKGGR